MYACMCAHACVCVCTYVHVCACVCVSMCVHVFVCGIARRARQVPRPQAVTSTSSANEQLPLHSSCLPARCLNTFRRARRKSWPVRYPCVVRHAHEWRSSIGVGNRVASAWETECARTRIHTLTHHRTCMNQPPLSPISSD